MCAHGMVITMTSNGIAHDLSVWTACKLCCTIST